MLSEKFIIYFGFPSTKQMLKNVENFAFNTNQSLEDAWIDLIHSFMRKYNPFENEDLFIPTVFSEVYEMQVVPPKYEQQKYPEILGEKKFCLPALSFKDDYVTCKETREKIKIRDEDLELLCSRLKIWVDIKDVSYAWIT
jgi:hypothetical protein